MITPDQAEESIHQLSLNLEQESVSLLEATGRVLKEDLFADSDLPPFHRVMMDGIAIRFDTFKNGLVKFRIQSIQRAGMPPLELEESEACIEVMTGAVCPEKCDTVVPYEHIRIVDGYAYIETPPASMGKNIHSKGSDKTKGALLVKSGAIIGASEIGIAASIGKTTLCVKRKPRVLVCSTGDELVEIQEQPLAHQIRRSNVYALKAALQAIGIQAEDIHLPDDEQQLRGALSNALHSFDVILLSGGVSKGKYDLVPQVMKQLGVNVVFHGIAQRPGKPMWFGNSERTMVFALPGNPVSTLACAARYVLPWLKKELGNHANQVYARISEEIMPHEKMTLFLPLQLETSKEEMVAHVLKNQGSGDFSALSGMTGFAEVGPGSTAIPAGTLLRLFPIR